MKKSIAKLFIIFILIVIVSIMLIVLLNKKVIPIYMEYSEIEMKRVVTTVINKSINEIELSDNLFILKNDDDIKIIDYDPKVLNSILSNISNNVYDNLKLVEKMDNNILNRFNISKSIFYIPSFIIFNSVMLNNLGPKIPIKLELIESVNSNVETKVTEYGINNSLIEVSVKVNTSVKMILPLSSKDVDVSVVVPLTIKIIQGSIPEYYFGDLKRSS
ncbi:MAG: sporulation protein YunB [Bacilli bacterium]|nr:sporulation protein YunB [Bacilli bacterium]